jgi:putative transposase
MHLQGVRTHKVKAITEEVCGHSFSASSLSAINQWPDADLAHAGCRPFGERARVALE